MSTQTIQQAREAGYEGAQRAATRARRARVIVACGYAPTRSSNGSPKVLWRAANVAQASLPL